MNRVIKNPCILIGGIIFLGLLFLGWQQYILWRLPESQITIPPIEGERELEIPPRPGIQGLIITGPVVKPLYFSVDLSKSGIRSLDWRQLQTIDPHTDVKINCQIDEQGRLVFSRDDVLMGGHTEAGMMIQQALRTWIYTPLKTGPIQFWFNLPSKGKKLVIDMGDLRRKENIPPHIPIYNGQMYLIDGISYQEIEIE
ncbi:hypothetical protein JW824_03810 [bacterium]|nr:hypothetical protein [bacterium]RQV97436.1 MAG: hypothetical protein EH221_03795 [bacterium]